MADASAPTPLRVAFVVSTFDYGGLERCVARIINHLDRSQFEPLVVCLGRAGQASRWIADPAVEIVELHKRRGNDVGVIFRLARVFRRRQIDLVHSHNWGTLLEVVLAARLSGAPAHLHMEHGMELDALKLRGWRQRLRNIAMRWGWARADVVGTVADSVKNRIIGLCHWPADRVKIIPNGVDVVITEADREKARQLRQSLGISENADIIGSVGRLAPVKNFGAAIQAVSHLQRAGRDVHLIVLGEGAERRHLTELALSAHVGERVHLVGEHEDIAPWLALMSVYLNCSVSEAMNLGILEAMSAGVPTVVTDVGQSASLVGGPDPCGLVVAPSDPVALAEAVKELLGNPGLRAAMSARATARHARRFSTARMAEMYEEVYRDIVTREASDPARPGINQSRMNMHQPRSAGQGSL